MPRTAKICQSNFRFWPILSTPGSSRSGLMAANAARLWNLIGSALALEQAAIAVAALAVRDRHVTGLVGRQRQRKAAQPGLHRIETRGLGVDRDIAEIARALDPGVEPRKLAHGFVFRAVEFLAMRDVEPRRGQRLRRERSRHGRGSPCPARWGGRGGGRLARRSRAARSGRVELVIGRRFAPTRLRVVLPRKRGRRRCAIRRRASRPVRSRRHRSKRTPPRAGSAS